MSKVKTIENQSKENKRVTLRKLLKESGLRQDFLAKNLKCSGANISIVSKLKVQKFNKGTVAYNLLRVLIKQINHNNKVFRQKGGKAKA
jgi:transcriptional regulator